LTACSRPCYVLGIRKIRITEPYIKNFAAAKKLLEANEDVVLQYASKAKEAILEYLSPDKI
jgi:hypothetical protein